MNPSKRGLGTGAKVGAVVVVLVLVAGVVYLFPTLRGGGSQSGPVTNVGADGPSGIYPLIQDFSQMTIRVDTNDVPDQVVQNQTFAYTVLGTGTLGSTQYTKVEFVTVDQEADVVGWFNSTGGIGFLEVLSDSRNYTGNAVDRLPFITSYIDDFVPFLEYTNNATFYSNLVPSSSATTSIGSLKANVTTYVASAPTRQYSNLIVKYATFSATNLRLAVYIYEKVPDKSTESLEITSLTR